MDLVIPRRANGHATRRSTDPITVHPMNADDAPQPSPPQSGTDHELAAFEAERTRLEAEIAAARQRAADARARTQEREAAVKRSMREEVEATRRTIVELEARHREALALIAETAELEIARLRAEAGVARDEAGVDRV